MSDPGDTMAKSLFHFGTGVQLTPETIGSSRMLPDGKTPESMLIDPTRRCATRA